MAKNKEIEITIDVDGTVHLDAINFEGKVCNDTIEKIRRKLGKVKESNKKSEYYRRKDKVSERETD